MKPNIREKMVQSIKLWIFARRRFYVTCFEMSLCSIRGWSREKCPLEVLMNSEHL